VIACCEVKAAVLIVPELFDHPIADTNRRIEPLVVKRQLIQRKQAVHHVGVVVEVAVETGAAVLVTMQKARPVPERLEDEIRIGLRNRAVICAVKARRRFGEGAQHKAIPIRQHLFIPPGPYSLFACGIQFLFGGFDFGFKLVIRIASNVQDVGMFPVAVVGHVEVVGQLIRIFSCDLSKFREASDVKLAFDILVVCILR